MEIFRAGSPDIRRDKNQITIFGYFVSKSLTGSKRRCKMKALSLMFMVAGGLGLLLAMLLGILDMVFPLGHIPADSFIKFTIVCLLFSIALSIFKSGEAK